MLGSGLNCTCYARGFRQWWSLETWSRSRRFKISSRDPFLQVSVSVLKVSGLVLASKVSALDTLNIAKKCFIKIYIIQRFLFVVFAGKKQPKDVAKCQKFAKNWSQKWWQHFLTKFRKNAQILKSLVSVSNFKSRVSVSEFLMKSWSRSRSTLEILTKTRSQSRRLQSRLHHWF